MKIDSITKMLTISAMGLFILGFLPYLLSSFMKPSKLFIGTTPIDLSSGLFESDYFYSILGFSYLSYQLFYTILNSNPIVTSLYSNISQEWIYVSIALALLFGIAAVLIERRVEIVLVSIILGFIFSSVAQLYFANSFLSEFINSGEALRTILSLLVPSSMIYLILSLTTSLFLSKFILHQKRLVLPEERKVTPVTEIKKEEEKKEKPSGEVPPKIPEVKKPEEETKEEQKLFVEEQRKEPEVLPLPSMVLHEEKKEEIQETQPIQEVVKPTEEEPEKLIELPEEIFKEALKEEKEKEVPLKEEPRIEKQVQEEVKPEVTKVEETEKKEKKREPVLVISELEQPLKELRESKYKLLQREKSSIHCNVCGFELVWDEELGHFRCPVCGNIQ